MARKHGISLLAALGMFGAVYLVDDLLAKAGLHAEATCLDDVLLALAVGVLVFFLEQQHEHRLSEQRNRARIIAQMNHHIRNALQVIVCRTSLEDLNSQELEDIKSAVDRIDWALREILTAKRMSAADKANPQDARITESAASSAASSED
jgi:signal transduction histidine kinase